MTKFASKLALGAVLGATVLTAAAPADAQRYRSRHRDNTGAAVFAGIAGVAIGAALAGDRRYDYDRRYYRQHGYYPTNGYYYRQNYRRYNSYDNCYVRRVWDPYQGRRVAVRYCD
jgi:hypothetical protein